MKSRYLINLILLCLVIALFWFNNQTDKTPSTAIKISTVEINDINYITVKRRDRDNIIINKRNEQWHIDAPYMARANPTRVDLLLSILNTPSNKQLALMPHSQLAQYGITPSSTTLTLNDTPFIFGDVEPLSKHRYVLAEQTLHLLDDRIAPLLNANATSFIDNRLVPSSAKISQLDIPYFNETSQSFDNQQRIIVEDKKGQWVSQPSQNADSLQELIDHWQYSQALQVLPLSRIKQLDKATTFPITITLVGGNNSQQYEATFANNILFLIDTDQRLAYQFSPGLIHQLFPKKKP